MYTSIDLFAGIGGIRLGFENAFGNDIKTVYASEWDANANKTYKANFHDDFEIAGDITKVKEEDIPQFDICLAGFPCLTGDTLIATESGYKEMLDVKPGEKVLSHDGKYHEVTNFMMQGYKDVYQIKAVGIIDIKATANHRFYVRKCNQILDNDNRTYKRVLDSPEWKAVEEMMPTENQYDNYYFLGQPINTESKLPIWNGVTIWKNHAKKEVVNTLKLDSEDLWYIVGRYLGDGWLRKQYKKGKNRIPYDGVIICAGEKKLDSLVERVEKCFHYTISHERTADRVIITNSEFAMFMKQFGEYANGKCLPSFVYDLPNNLLKALILGYTESDGTYDKKKDTITLASINLKLLYGISMCISKVYRVPSTMTQVEHSRQRLIEGRKVNTKDSYSLTFSTDTSKKHHAIIEDDYIWFPIRKIFRMWKMPVYDIEVSEAHSFVANNCVTHNCQAFSMAGKHGGFEDDYHGRCRGTLFLDVVRICDYHKPKVIFCENVKGLTQHDKGRTFQVIKSAFEEIGYTVFDKVLNSKDFGVPQNRERIYLVCFRNDLGVKEFHFPEGNDSTKTIRDILDAAPVPSKYYLSETYMDTLIKHRERHEAAGHGFGYVIRDLDGISGTIVCGGMGREGNLIKDEREHSMIPTTHIKGEINKDSIRKMTPREWARLQGFPDDYKLELADTHLYKQFGNSVTVSVIEAIAKEIRKVLG